MNKKGLLLNAIEDMLSGNIDENNPICENLDNLEGIPYPYTVVRKLSPNWEYFSGDVNYPVSGEEIWNQGLDDTLFWWTGEQLELRMSLLEHIKCEVSKLTNEEFEEMFK